MPKEQQLALIAFLFLLIFIPLMFFLVGERMRADKPPTLSYNTTLTQPPSPTPSPTVRNVLGLATDAPTPPPETNPTTYGPTLSFKVALEGRPTNHENAKIFIGIAEGLPTESPQYLLSYTVDTAADGSYSGVSVLGLLQGTTYTAYLKGPTQLVKAITFVMTPNGGSLNNNQPILLLSGDLNQDNAVDDADLQIEQGLIGTTSHSTNWNSNADFNQDNVVNSLDLLLVRKNLGTVGDSGKWYSRVGIATASAQLTPSPSVGGLSEPPATTPNGSQNGHWVWVPDLSQ